MAKLTKKYGLLTAVSMVVGIVIGSGVFFKAQVVLTKTEGNMPMGILAWIIGGAVMIFCAYAFSIMAGRYEKVNGLVDYAEVTLNSKYAYYVGWFMSTIYLPSMTSVLAWVSSRYFCELLGWSMKGPECMILAGFFLITSYCINAISPKLAGKIQVSATIVKLVPLVLMAAVGIVVGIAKGTLGNAFATIGGISQGKGNLFAAVVSTAFAYEGWILATSINSEIKDSKKNLPLALVFGCGLVMVIYILYFIGVAGGATVEDLINKGATVAFTNLFGNVGGAILTVFIVVSCLGTLNGLMLASTRSIYALSARNQGMKPEVFSQIDEKTNMPNNSAIASLFFCAVWLVYFYGANLVPKPWFGLFSFDSSELPIITIYAFYIPVFVKMMIQEKDLNVFKRFVAPSLAILGCLFMIGATIYSHGIVPFLDSAKQGQFSMPVLFYLVVFVLIMSVGGVLLHKGKPSLPQTDELDASSEQTSEAE